MSDTFILCPKCGEELSYIVEDCYYCYNCASIFTGDQAGKLTTEYFKGEENEQGNQSSRSKE